MKSSQTAPSQQDSLEHWLNYLLAIHPSEIDMGLDRINQVAQRMNLLDLGDTKVITVGGTNGKGSTCAIIESILTQANLRVGVYSSPHIIRYNERIRICGQDVQDADLTHAFEAIEQARADTSLTFFEFATLAGLYLFKREKLDIVILEVGLGGRLDATNIIDADVAIVTAIGLDHVEYLGDNRESIGYEKAGIFKAGKQAITGDPDLPQSVVQVASEKSATLGRVGHEFSYTRNEQSWNFSGQHFQLKNLPIPNLPLANAATALAAIESLFPTLGQDIIAQGLDKASLTGRFERVSETPSIFLDVAHNPHAATYLASQLQAFKGCKILALCGMLKDKDIQGVLSIMSPVIDKWFVTSLSTERGADAEILVNALPKNANFDSFNELSQAWQALKNEIQQKDIAIVFGSFYTVSGVKTLMGEE